MSGALLLAMSPWFAATAVAGELELRWGLAPGQGVALTVWVQWGFVVGTALTALLNVADVVPSGRLFAASALAVAMANAGLLAAGSYPGAALLRFLTGVFMAGVYPPAMKMVATWFRSARGFAIGTVVGALTVGKALPYLVKSAGGAGLAPVVWGTSGAAALAGFGILVLYRDGPWAFPSRPFAWSRVGELLRHRPTMLATGGYLGHMWELYAAWSLALPLALQVLAPGRGADLAAFAFIAVGGVGAVAAGRMADVWGRIGVANGAMAVSGSSALLLGWTLEAPPWIPLGIGLVWGLTVVADSAQFSAVVTEVAPAHAVGTALTLQTMLGFALTGISIDLTPRLVSAWGWGPGLAILALGPAAGIASMRALRRVRDRDGTVVPEGRGG